MYKLLNKLFGWDYIVWKNSCDQGIARIHVDASGQVYYWCYEHANVAAKIQSAESVDLWLTCKPEKYISSQKETK